MAKRRLRWCLREGPRNVGPSATAGPVPPTIPQWCMHLPRVKCVQANACLCWAINRYCMSGLPSEKYRNQGPTQAPTATRLTTNVSQNIKKAQESARTLCQAIPLAIFHPDAPSLSPSILARGAEWPTLPTCANTANAAQELTETAALNPVTPAAVKLRTSNGWSNRIPQYSWQYWQWHHVGGQFWSEWRRLRLCQVGRKITHEIGQHAKPRGTHQQTGNNARGLRGRDLRHRPTNGWRGRIRDSLPVRESVGELTVRYQKRNEYKSYFYGFQRNAFPRKRFSTKVFSTKCFPQYSGKSRCGKSKESYVNHYFCRAYCTAADNWYLSGLVE